MNESPIRPRLGFSGLRYGIALILLVAASLKAYQISMAPLPPIVQGSVFTSLLELLNGRNFLMVVVVCELLWALVLIADFCRPLAWLASLIGFSVFTLVSLIKGIAGEADCGCWGNFTVNPFATMVFDLVFVALLLVCRERVVWTFPVVDRKKLTAVVVAWLVLAGPALFFMLSLKQQPHATLGTEFTGADGKKTILLEPETWIGKEFPLFSRFVEPEGAEVLKQGTWDVLLIHTDCPKCLQMMADLEARRVEKISIVVVPSGSNEKVYNTSFSMFCLDNRNDWFVTTPCVVRISEGICVEVGENVDEN